MGAKTAIASLNWSREKPVCETHATVVVTQTTHTQHQQHRILTSPCGLPFKIVSTVSTSSTSSPAMAANDARSSCIAAAVGREPSDPTLASCSSSDEVEDEPASLASSTPRSTAVLSSASPCWPCGADGCDDSTWRKLWLQAHHTPSAWTIASAQHAPTSCFLPALVDVGVHTHDFHCSLQVIAAGEGQILQYGNVACRA